MFFIIISIGSQFQISIGVTPCDIDKAGLRILSPAFIY